MLNVRVGIPLPSGRMIEHLLRDPVPVLFSANAFFGTRPNGDRFLRPVKLPPGLDAALDSAGFVAMVRYGRYPWTDEEYLNLVGSYDWAWYSCPDYCVEAAVARDRKTVRMRLAGTVSAYYRLRSKARDRGLPDPMPILQGATLSDYLYCAERLPTDGLVGLGSFCRRNTNGEDGIVHLIDQLSRALPKARFHAFGVKGKALEYIGQHPSVASVDSMAWDVQARTSRRVGRSIEFRMEVMRNWLAQNLRRKRHGHGILQIQQRFRDLQEIARLEVDPDDEVAEWQALVEDGEMSLEDASRYMDHLWVGWQELASRGVNA